MSSSDSSSSKSGIRSVEKLSNVDLKEKFNDIIDDKLCIYQNEAKGIVEPREFDCKRNRVAVLDQLRKQAEIDNARTPSISTVNDTNFSNDSASIIMLLGNRIPRLYFNKCLNRVKNSKVKHQPAPATAKKPKNGKLKDDYYGPYFLGTQDEMAKIIGTKDRFYTHPTRIKKDLRSNRAFDIPPFEDQLFGKDESCRKPGLFATQQVEDYIEVMKSRPNFLQKFDKNNFITKIRQTVRTQITKNVIKEENYRIASFIEAQNEAYVELCQLLHQIAQFVQNTKDEWFRSTMRILEEVKPTIEVTEKMRRELDDLEAELVLLNNE
jgi:hypothetical protein